MIVLTVQKLIVYSFWFYLLTVCVLAGDLISHRWHVVKVLQGSHNEHTHK